MIDFVENFGEWWRNPERDSLWHYSLDGLESVCHREFNSEWQVDAYPKRPCKTCLKVVESLVLP